MPRRRPRLPPALPLALLVLFGAGCSDDSSGAEDATRSFRAPVGWETLAAPPVEPSCAGDDCGAVTRRWSADRPPTAAQVEEAAEAAGWDDVVVEGCDPEAEPVEPYCELTAVHDGTDLHLTVAGPLPGEAPWEITLEAS